MTKPRPDWIRRASKGRVHRLWEQPTSVVSRIRRRLTPARLLVLSFAFLVLAGTAGLMWLPGLYVGEPLTLTDALFTATSAVCVTGLIVVDTATYFTPSGQAFILLLIQLGGLGILTLTTVVIVTLGRRLSLHHQAVTSSTSDLVPDIDYRQLVRRIVVFTLLFELVGAVLLFLAWLPRFDTAEAAWHAVFQAISAFCNAGFSTFSDSLTGFSGGPITLGVIMTLIVLGGLGFLTLEEVHLGWRDRKETRRRFSLHSRIVLVMTAGLLASGWVAFTALEWSQTLSGMPVWQKLLNGLFMSVTARTAGFSTVDYASASETTNFLNILFMSIGGSPGSTAGGLKTTGVAVIALLAWSRFRGRQVTSVASRTIPDETVQRTVGLFVVGFVLVTGAILALTGLHLEPFGSGARGAFLEYMFEAVSAFNTVGLSMGVTGDLTGPGRLLVVFLMFVGRVGPLTIAAAIALHRPTSAGEFRYSYEDVIIG